MSKNLIPSYPLRLSPELKAEMVTQAKSESLNLNKAIAKAIRFYLNSKKETPSASNTRSSNKIKDSNND
ncbi:hypothetical protein [Nostoc sp.]|uniref:hypothetical protein n=1 Tax=Nostoc sp. TaxID=1180 RepID=UPI002FFACFF7